MNELRDQITAKIKMIELKNMDLDKLNREMNELKASSER